MVVAIAELGDVLMQMAKRDLVVLDENAAFQQTPESFNGVGVNFAVSVGEFVVDRSVRHETFDSHIALVLIRDKNCILAINVLPNEFSNALVSQFLLIHWHGDDSTAPFYDSDHRRFIGSASARQILFPATRWTVALARLAANIGFVHFDNALKQVALFKHGVANPHSHVPRGILIDFEIAGQLASGESLL